MSGDDSHAAKLPVFGAAARAYEFAFANIPAILRIGLPAGLIYIALDILMLLAGLEFAALARDPAANAERLAVAALVNLTAAVLAAIVATGLARLLILDRGPEDAGPIYLRFTWDELRVAGIAVAVVLAVLTYIALTQALLELLTGAPAGRAGPGDPPPVAVLPVPGPVAVAILALPLVYVVLRLALLPAIAVAENAIDPVRAWGLTRGNGLRLLVATVLTVVPFLVLAFLAAVGLSILNLMPVRRFPGDLAVYLQPLSPRFWAYWTLQLLSGLFALALTAGLLGHAYRTLRGAAGEETLPAAAEEAAVREAALKSLSQWVAHLGRETGTDDPTPAAPAP